MDEDGKIHPVEIGLADAYTRAYNIDGKLVTVHYHYHAVDVAKSLLRVNSSLVFEPLPSKW